MADPPESPGTSPLVLYEEGVEVGALEWNAGGEEVIGPGRFAVTVQDRLGSDWEPQVHKDYRLAIRSSDWTLQRGESMQVSVELPVAEPFRRWVIACRDYNARPAETLFGAPDGGNFWRPNDREPYRPVDPSAVGGETAIKIADWIEHYLPTVGPVTIETATHVHSYPMAPGDALDMQDAMSTLDAAIAALAGYCTVNVQDWLDPDGFWHHVAIPDAVTLLDDGDEGDLEAAPTAIGPGGKGHMGISFAWDGQSMPEQIYLQAATTWAHEDGKTDSPGASGFYPTGVNPNVPASQLAGKRQAYLSAPGAWTRDGGITIATAALRRAAYPTLRGTFAVEGVDGWRAGQVVTINDARLPPSLQGSHKFVVQRIGWTLYSGLDARRYQIDFGDGPVSRANSGGRRPATVDALGDADKRAKLPAISFPLEWVDADGHPDTSPIGEGETREAIAYTANARGELRLPIGASVTFGVVARDADPDSPTYGDVVPDQGTFAPNPATTDQDGKARSTFTAGTGKLAYQPFAEAELPLVA